MTFGATFGRVFSPTFQPNSQSSAAAAGWWLSGGIAAANCVAAYRAKGAASLAASYINLNNPGTYELTGATPTWDAAIGWTSYVMFNSIGDVLSLPTTVVWRGRLDKASGNYNVMGCTVGWNGGLIVHSYYDSNLYAGMNSNITPRFAVAIADYSIQHTIVYQKLADNSQNLWIDGNLVTGSPKAGTAVTDLSFKLATGNLKCEAAAVYKTALSDAQVSALTIAMNAL